MFILRMQDGKLFGNISKEERLFNIRAEGFLWSTISWNKQGVLGYILHCHNSLYGGGICDVG